MCLSGIVCACVCVCELVACVQVCMCVFGWRDRDLPFALGCLLWIKSRVEGTALMMIGALVDALVVLVQMRVGRVVRRMGAVCGMSMGVRVVCVMAECMRRVRLMRCMASSWRRLTVASSIGKARVLVRAWPATAAVRRVDCSGFLRLSYLLVRSVWRTKEITS